MYCRLRSRFAVLDSPPPPPDGSCSTRSALMRFTLLAIGRVAAHVRGELGETALVRVELLEAAGGRVQIVVVALTARLAVAARRLGYLEREQALVEHVADGVRVAVGVERDLAPELAVDPRRT